MQDNWLTDCYLLDASSWGEKNGRGKNVTDLVKDVNIGFTFYHVCGKQKNKSYKETRFCVLACIVFFFLPQKMYSYIILTLVSRLVYSRPTVTYIRFYKSQVNTYWHQNIWSNLTLEFIIKKIINCIYVMLIEKERREE